MMALHMNKQEELVTVDARTCYTQRPEFRNNHARACPGFTYEGLHRVVCGKKKHDVPDYRKICAEIAAHVVDRLRSFWLLDEFSD
jgi:predicted secreted protein